MDFGFYGRNYEKDYSLDLGLIQDESVIDSENLLNPIVTAKASIDKLEEAVDLLKVSFMN